MSKIDVVRAAMVAAMKSKEKERKDALSMLLSALKNAEIDKREPLTEDEENAVVKKEIKQLKETWESAPADRTDIREEAQFRMSVYQEFAPEDMSEEQIREVIGQVLSQLGIDAPHGEGQGKDHEGADAPGEGEGGRQGSEPDSGIHVPVRTWMQACRRQENGRHKMPGIGGNADGVPRQN